MDNLWPELAALKRDRTREQRIAATWQVMAHQILNKKTFNVFRYLGPKICWRYIRLCYYIELAVSVPDKDFEYNPKQFEEGAFAQNETQKIRPTTCLVSQTGGGLPFCSIEHMHAYTRNFDEGLGNYRIAQTSPKVKYCSHCVMCGSIIRRPAPGLCMLHGEDSCPDVDVYGTFFSGELIRCWQNLTKSLPYDEDIEAMNLLADSNPELTAYELVIVHWNLINPNP